MKQAGLLWSQRWKLGIRLLIFEIISEQFNDIDDNNKAGERYHLFELNQILVALG